MTGEYFTQADLWATAAETVNRLSAALSEEIRTGRVTSSVQAARFVRTWSDALDAARPKPRASQGPLLPYDESGEPVRERNP